MSAILSGCGGSPSLSRLDWSRMAGGSSRADLARSPTSRAMWCFCCRTPLADQLNGLGDGVAHVEVAGVEQNGVVGLAQGCHFALGVAFVPGPNVDQHIIVMRWHAAFH